MTEGRLLVYFHGAPGSPAEADLLHASATANGLRVFCQDRFALDAFCGLAGVQTHPCAGPQFAPGVAGSAVRGRKFSRRHGRKSRFPNSQAADKTLSGNASFRSQISEILVQCFRLGVAGYIRDVRAYVHPWHDDLQEIKVPTHLWHGEQDNWSPIAMSEYLRQQLPNVKSFTRMPRMSHYSCLYAAAPEICSAVQPAAV